MLSSELHVRTLFICMSDFDIFILIPAISKHWNSSKPKNQFEFLSRNICISLSLEKTNYPLLRKWFCNATNYYFRWLLYAQPVFMTHCRLATYCWERCQKMVWNIWVMVKLWKLQGFRWLPSHHLLWESAVTAQGTAHQNRGIPWS